MSDQAESSKAYDEMTKEERDVHDAQQREKERVEQAGEEIPDPFSDER